MLKIYKYAEYHNDNENSHKYYAVCVYETSAQNSWSVRWGRVGTTGQTQELSQHECLNRFVSKIVKGYSPVVPDPSLVRNLGAKDVTGFNKTTDDLDNERAKRKSEKENFNTIEKLIAAIK